jgi:hypothetical protein
MRFINSDPNLVHTFLSLLRRSFNIDENKFRVCIHLHDYHNELRQIKFWSKITDIPTGKFLKSFRKSNTGKRVRNNYNGCVSIRYHDVMVSRELLMTAQAFFINSGA